MGTLISFKRPDGREARGYLANSGRGDAPGVVVIQEWWGLVGHIKNVCERFAAEGFSVYPLLATSIRSHEHEYARWEGNTAIFMPRGKPLATADASKPSGVALENGSKQATRTNAAMRQVNEPSRSIDPGLVRNCRASSPTAAARTGSRRRGEKDGGKRTGTSSSIEGESGRA